MTTTALPPYLSRPQILERLLAIFPEGVPFRSYCTRDIAGGTVFAMLYVGAVDGSGRYLAPKQVYRMSDEQASLESDAERLAYADASLRPGFLHRGSAWYADTTREPIRDETLRQGLVPTGAVHERKDIATTSSKPRYALSQDFAALLHPALEAAELAAAISHWQKAHLTAGALARVALVRAGASKDEQAYFVTFPNGETQRLTPGISSVITKAVIEEFASRFLRDPAVLWVSESGNKVVARHDIIAKSIGLEIDPSKHLPDIILADLGDKNNVLLVFIEVVATDGPISEHRRSELMHIARDAGHEEGQVAFVTAFEERGKSAFRKCFPDLAWQSFVWFASEPSNLVGLFGSSIQNGVSIHQLLGAATKPSE